MLQRSAGPLLLLSAALVACGGPPAPPSAAPAPGAATPAALQPIRLALNWVPEPEFGGFYEGVLGGHYAAEGFDVQIIAGGPGAPTLELLSAGRAEVAITAADDLLLKRAKGAAAVGVWAAFQDTPQGLMVHAGGPVQQLTDVPAGDIAIKQAHRFAIRCQQLTGARCRLLTRVQTIGCGATIRQGGKGSSRDGMLLPRVRLLGAPCLKALRKMGCSRRITG